MKRLPKVRFTMGKKGDVVPTINQSTKDGELSPLGKSIMDEAQKEGPLDKAKREMYRGQEEQRELLKDALRYYLNDVYRDERGYYRKKNFLSKKVYLTPFELDEIMDRYKKVLHIK